MKTSNYKKQIESIVNSIEITSLSNFKVKGKEEFISYQMPYTTFSGDLKSFGNNNVIDDNQRKQNLIQSLTNSIYAKFYCGISDEKSSSKLPSKVEREVFMDELSEANKTVDGLDYNWMIYNVDATGNAFVKKNDELRWLQPNGYQFNDPNQKQAQVNTKVNLVTTRENKGIQPVFYHVFSKEIFPQEVELSRFYWNVRPDGAAKLIELITSTLNDYKIPFQFKCLNHPELYVRTDSAVLYLDKKHVHIVSVILKSIITELKPYLVDSIPMFTQELYKGVGYAEDPGKGMSFGMSRSSVVAEALVESFLKDEKETIKTQSVINYLESKGMSIDRLHLNKHTLLTPNFPNYA